MSKLFPQKRQWKKWSLPSKMGYIGFWIALIGLPAIIITYSSSISNFFNRNPEIIDMKPYVYVDEREDFQHKDFHTPIDLGVFFIIHIKNGSKTSTINGMKIKAEKYPLDFIDYFSLHKNDGRAWDEVEKEWKIEKPYYTIEWDAYISDKNIKKVLFPHDEAFIGITLLDPTLSGQSESFWKTGRENYVGYESGDINPIIIRKYPDFGLIFSDYNINTLPPKIINKELEFFLIINNKEISIDRKLIKFVDRVSKHEYENDSFEKMYLRYYAE